MSTARVFRVEDIQMERSEGAALAVVVSATGTAATPGWTAVRLEPLEEKLSVDGILDLAFVGEVPDVPVPQVMTPVSAGFVVKKDAERLIGVRVVARTNELTQMLRPPFTRGGPGVTTAAVGEEGPGPKTLALGEEGLGPTTLALGEEGLGPTTLMLGEEGPKTILFGEEGPKTTLFGEEGPKTALLGEEGQKPSFGETDPRVDDPAPDTPGGSPLPGRRNPFGGRG